MRNISRSLAALFMVFAGVTPQLAFGGKTNNFYGEVVHVSTTNLKVYDPRARQTLSFELEPKFDQVFSADGKTTYQMRYLRHGQYVRVVYDQKLLGMRHADKIYILNNANMKTGTQIPSHIH